jgi:hypothetical protein
MERFIFKGPHLDKLVCMLSADFRIPDHLLKFLVKKLIPPVPGDPGSDVREKEQHQFLEIQFHALFPGAVIIVGYVVFQGVHSDILYTFRGKCKIHKKGTHKKGTDLFFTSGAQAQLLTISTVRCPNTERKGDRFIFMSEETRTMDNSSNTLPGWDAIAQAMQAMMMLTGAGSAENKSPFTIRVAGQGPGDG